MGHPDERAKVIVITPDEMTAGRVVYGDHYRHYIAHRFEKEHGLAILDWSLLKYKRTDREDLGGGAGIEVHGVLGLSLKKIPGADSVNI